jgi:two-component system response regulator FixJ
VQTPRLFIAVVDDELSVRKALSRLLRVSGLDVETFANGLDFLEFVRARRPDCLVLDVNLPGLSGLEVQNRLAEAGIRMPTVVITGHDGPDLRDRVLTAGAAVYLLKPVDKKTLLNAVNLAVKENLSDS